MKKILVTGASKGIGYSTAIQLAENGHHVFAIARSKKKLIKLTTESFIGKITTISADLTTSEGIEKIGSALSDFESIDALINNAGALINKPFMETTTEDWLSQFDINVLSSVRLIKSLKGKLKKGSHIVNISSMGGFQGSSKFPGLAAYSTSKGALTILSECLSSEFTGEGIAVNCLCLGAVQTEMLEKAFPGYIAPTNPDEMGAFVAHFTLTAHSFFNGKVLPVALNNPE
ncbi:MAG: SDR family NAD(P)-dependent oxidoreductase [Balneolaceae bacterium]